MSADMHIHDFDTTNIMVDRPEAPRVEVIVFRDDHTCLKIKGPDINFIFHLDNIQQVEMWVDRISQALNDPEDLTIKEM